MPSDPTNITGCGPLVPPTDGDRRPLRQQIFERIRAAGALPRVGIAKQLNISPATVTAISADLIDQGLVQEISSPREAGRGRPPVALGVRPDAHVVAGVKLSDWEHTVVLADFAGQTLTSASLQRKTPISGLGELMTLITDLVDTACQQADVARSDLSALGIGVPGFVAQPLGMMHWSPILRSGPVELATEVQHHLGVPTIIDNDANLATLAELWFGAGREESDFAVVTIEHGVGMGVVIDHKLFRGAKGLGLELGHTKVQKDGALCRCGQRGCLEAYLADYALAREASTALGLTMQAPQEFGTIVERLHQEAREGHAGARTIFRRAGGYLALGLANVANLFDPERIILSGARMQYDLLYTEDVLDEVARLALPAHRPAPVIEVHAWGDLIWARGAVALALNHVSNSVLGEAREKAA